MLKEIIKKVERTLNNEGILSLLRKTIRKILWTIFPNKPTYKQWINKVESKYLNKESILKEIEKLEYKPLLSVVIPVYNTEIEYLDKAIRSVLNQYYDNYEICISDGSTGKFKKVTEEYLKEISREHSDKIKLISLDKREGVTIVSNTNNAISITNGEYIVFMDCDDELSKNCLYELAKGINEQPNVKFLYSDFDHISTSGKRFSPSFWPDWSPHLLLSQMYTTHVTCYKKDTLDELKNLRKGTDGAQDWDLVLRFSQIAQREDVYHIPKILYHWRVHENSTAMAGGNSKGWAYDIQIKVLKQHVERLGYKSKIMDGQHPGIFKTDIEVEGDPKISILIAFRDKVDYLQTCIESIKKNTKYNNYEIVLIDNQSEEEDTLDYLKSLSKDIKILKYDKPFHFGKMYNWACSQVKSDYLLILNNDIKVITENWLSKLLGYAQLKNSGYVGAKLLYPDNRIQHAGVLVGHRGVAGHLQVLAEDCESGYLSSLMTTRNYLALTGACLMIKKEKFFEVGGFEETLDPSYQDVDLGIKLYERGYYNVYIPDVKITHYESLSRLDPKFNKGLISDNINAKRLRAIWPQYIVDRRGNDPFYNPNLSYEESDCRISLEDNINNT